MSAAIVRLSRLACRSYAIGLLTRGTVLLVSVMTASMVGYAIARSSAWLPGRSAGPLAVLAATVFCCSLPVVVLSMCAMLSFTRQRYHMIDAMDIAARRYVVQLREAFDQHDVLGSVSSRVGVQSGEVTVWVSGDDQRGWSSPADDCP